MICWRVSNLQSNKKFNAKSKTIFASEAEINLEAMEAAISQNIRNFVPGQSPRSLLLSLREAKAMVELDNKFFRKRVNLQVGQEIWFTI